MYCSYIRNIAETAIYRDKGMLYSVFIEGETRDLHFVQQTRIFELEKKFEISKKCIQHLNERFGSVYLKNKNA